MTRFSCLYVKVETGVYVKSWIKIIDLNHEIHNKSTLRIKAKPEVNLRPVDAIHKIIEQKEDKRLIEGQNEIKLFEAIVRVINIGWNLTKKNWNQVFEKLETRPHYKSLVRKLGLNKFSISTLFFKWAKYYATVCLHHKRGFSQNFNFDSELRLIKRQIKGKPSNDL